MTKPRALLFVGMYIAASLVVGPRVEASFQLERADGSRKPSGLAMGTVGLQDVAGTRYVAPVAPPAPRPHPRLQSPTRLPGASSSRCGGDLPPCWVMMRESRGDTGAYNPTGCSGRGCYGKWQFDPRTGDGTGTEAEQDAEARRVWDGGRGCSHWAAC